MIRLFIAVLLISFVGYSVWSTFQEEVPPSALQAIEPIARDLSAEVAPAVDTAKRATINTLKLVEGATGEVKAGIRHANVVGSDALEEVAPPPGDAGMDWYKDGGE